jgi:hypothetical protein
MSDKNDTSRYTSNDNSSGVSVITSNDTSDNTSIDTSNGTCNHKREVQKEVKRNVQDYTRLRPPNIKIENSRWDLDLDNKTASDNKIASGDMTPLPKPALNRSVQHVIDGYIDSDIESEL